MATRYIRRRNIELGRWTRKYSSSLKGNRGVINEMTFRIFWRCRDHNVTPAELGIESTRLAANEAVDFIRRFREFSRSDVRDPIAEEVEEAKELAARLQQFVDRCEPERVVVAPSFAGCGWVDECNGDMLIDSMLCEVKAGEHKFRSRDLRQVLTYAALNMASRDYNISSVCLVNPRLGVFLQEDLDELCQELSGSSASDVLGEIVSYISQPNWRDEAV